MKVEPEQTPNFYKSIKCIEHLDSGVKVFKNIAPSSGVFYYVAKEPPVNEITSPDDIVVLDAFQVGPNETEASVREEAIKTADNINPGT